MSERKQLKRPAGAAAEVLELCVRRYGSYAAVAVVYGERFGCDAKGAEKVFRRVREGRQATVNVDTLDRLCILAGTHLELVAG